MIEDTAVLDSRGILKRQLASGEYRALSDVILGGTGRLIQKLSGSREPASFLVSAGVVALIALSIGLLTAFALGELDLGRPQEMLFGPALVVIALTSVVLARIAQGNLVATLREHLVDAVELETDLVDLQHWLAAHYDMRVQLLFCVVWAVLVTSYVAATAAATEGRFAGFGMLLLSAITTFLGATLFYLLFLVISCCARLSHYRLKLYTTDPAHSPIVHHLSGMIGNQAFIGAMLSALYSLFYASISHLSTLVVIALAAMAWGPAIAVFVTGQRALTRIIAGGKWRALDGIQARIDELAAQGDLTDEATMDGIHRLMDLYDRIKGTRSSAVDFRAGLGFLNSLLLPLIAFLLANLDRVVALLS
jgi:hypothetical protein